MDTNGQDMVRNGQEWLAMGRKGQNGQENKMKRDINGQEV